MVFDNINALCLNGGYFWANTVFAPYYHPVSVTESIPSCILVCDRAVRRCLTVGAVIAVMLLVLYCITVIMMIIAAQTCSQAEQNAVAHRACFEAHVNSGTIYVATTVSGMISALIVVVLGATPPEKNPCKAVLQLEDSALATKAIDRVVV